MADQNYRRITELKPNGVDVVRQRVHADLFGIYGQAATPMPPVVEMSNIQPIG